MNLTRIKQDKPDGATHWNNEQQIYIAIDNGTWFFNGKWIQYDLPCVLKLVEL